MTTKDPNKIAQQEADSIRTRLLNDLETDAKRILTQLTQQFADSLQAQSDSFLESIDHALSSSGFGNLIAGAAFATLNQPHVRTAAPAETQRSVDATAQFRLSQNQALAEAGVTLSKGNKNL